MQICITTITAKLQTTRFKLDYSYNDVKAAAISITLISPMLA